MNEPRCYCGHGLEEHVMSKPGERLIPMPGACSACACKGFDEMRAEPEPAVFAEPGAKQPAPDPGPVIRVNVVGPKLWGWAWWRRSWFRTWLRAVVGIVDDAKAGQTFMTLTDANVRALAQLIGGLRRDLDGIGPALARLQFYESRSGVLMDLKERYEKEQRQRAETNTPPEEVNTDGERQLKLEP
jgi:hypothetical protein